MKPIYLHSRFSSDLEKDVQGALKKGFDLQGGLVAAENEIGQWVVESTVLYDYRLVVAATPEILNALVDGLTAEEWDFYRDTVLFDGNYHQWMLRENRAHALFGEKLRAALSTEFETPMVVDAQPVLRMAPVFDGYSMVTIPYPVNGS